MIRLILNNHKNSLRSLFANLGSNPVVITHYHPRFIHNDYPISKTPQNPIQSQYSFTASYLIHSCDLSPQSALSAAKKINFQTAEKPDSVIDLLKSYGFSKTQIAKLVVKLPLILCSNPERTIRPKLDFFLGVVGLSSAQLADIISSQPQYLQTSLEKRLKPNFHLLKDVLRTNQQMATAMRRSSWMLRVRPETNFLPNVKTLQLCGVPGDNIAKLAAKYPRSLVMTNDQFKSSAEIIMKMGFDPSLVLFVRGVASITALTPLSWERKLAVYKSIGWSEAEIISAFTKHPFCMNLSEEKIRRATDFFAKKMHWGPSYISRFPSILNFSFEKRIVPRCSVMCLLSSKGLIKKELGCCSFLIIADKKFLDKYVTKYADRVPEVLDAFNFDLGDTKFEVIS